MKTLLSLFLFISVTGIGAEKPHAVFVVGTHHYNPERSMPPLAGELEKHGFRCTLLLPNGDPEMNKNKEGIPGLDVLAEADLTIFFMRFLTLNDEQFGHVEQYVKSGKPVVGFRTSTHAFKYPKDHPRYRWNNDFGQFVLGTAYMVHQSGSTQLELIARHKGDPVLQGVVPGDNFVSPGTLYLTRLEPGCRPLVMGHGTGKGGLREGGFGTFFVHKEETDIVAWTWTNRFGGRTFGTSFGHVGDFASAPIMRIIVNGICWAAGVELPAADTEIGTFEIDDPRRKRRKK